VLQNRKRVEVKSKDYKYDNVWHSLGQAVKLKSGEFYVSVLRSAYSDTTKNGTQLQESKQYF